jgi:ankyrin repeat protein
MVQLLLRFGASVNLPDHDGVTPVMAVVMEPQEDKPVEAVLQLLLSREDVDLDATWNGTTAEAVAERGGHWELADMIRAEVRLSVAVCSLPLP